MKIITWITVTVQFAAAVFIIVTYILLFHTLKKSQEDLQITRNNSNTFIMDYGTGGCCDCIKYILLVT